jgi:peptide/nickel transport system ATP-binding protein
MCSGRIVELAPRQALFRNPVHPYTRALMLAVPYPDPDRPLDFKRIGAERQSNPSEWPEPFSAREGRDPPMIEIGGGHYVRAFAPPEAPVKRAFIRSAQN